MGRKFEFTGHKIPKYGMTGQKWLAWLLVAHRNPYASYSINYFILRFVVTAFNLVDYTFTCK